MEEIDFGEIQRVLDEILGNGMNFREMAEQGMRGENLLSFRYAAGFLQDVFLEELMAQKQLWIHILILAVAAAVLLPFADVFQNRSVSHIS